MTIAIIGGSGFAELNNFITSESIDLTSEYGEPSTTLKRGTIKDNNNQFKDLFFLARHGERHSIQPHNINYRANIDALSQQGVTKIIALAAVGSINKTCIPGTLVLPHQILDYTYNRAMTFFDKTGDVAHAEFTEPYSESMRQAIIKAAESTQTPLVTKGVYAVTQGPRFESSAEIKRFANDGASLVGMTAMPEAVLAREKGIAYVTIASVVNFAAGVQQGVISHDCIHQAYKNAAKALYTLLIPALHNAKQVNCDVPELIFP